MFAFHFVKLAKFEKGDNEKSENEYFKKWRKVDGKEMKF